MKKRFTEEQIIKVIKEHEAGAKVADICRRLGISNGTFYNWRSKYAGLEINEAKRLRELESENNKLKKLLAEKLLENEALKDVVSKKWRSEEHTSELQSRPHLVCRLLLEKKKKKKETIKITYNKI